MMQNAVAVLFDDSVAGVLAAAVNAENPHCGECSRRPEKNRLRMYPDVDEPCYSHGTMIRTCLSGSDVLRLAIAERPVFLRHFHQVNDHVLFAEV